jgi:hypothetical protein
MFRTALASLFVLAILAANVQAEDFPAILKKVDAEKKLITVTIFFDPARGLGAGPTAGQDKSYQLAKDVKVVDSAGKEVKDGLKSPRLKPDTAVIFSTDKNGVVTQLKVVGGARPR